ncbi:hypothetical protein LINGRAHAP2_LOCUS20336 [Linum grandiflorum]
MRNEDVVTLLTRCFVPFVPIILNHVFIF